MTILIDTNVLVGGIVPSDIHHQEAVRLLRELDAQDEPLIVPAPVLNELFYFVSRELGYRHAVSAFANVQKVFRIEALTPDDMRRMQQIMIRYASAEFDFADDAIMAQAERLQVTRVATFDRRDFSQFRPAHCEFLELLPN